MSHALHYVSGEYGSPADFCPQVKIPLSLHSARTLFVDNKVYGHILHLSDNGKTKIKEI
jgi:hypothetical protein